MLSLTLEVSEMPAITLEDYKRTDRQLAREEVRHGFIIDATVYAVVMTALIILNLTVANQFPWSVFPLVGWGIGLTLQYLLGLRWVGQSIIDRQTRIEQLSTAATQSRTGSVHAERLTSDQRGTSTDGTGRG